MKELFEELWQVLWILFHWRRYKEYRDDFNKRLAWCAKRREFEELCNRHGLSARAVLKQAARDQGID